MPYHFLMQETGELMTYVRKMKKKLDKVIIHSKRLFKSDSINSPSFGITFVNKEFYKIFNNTFNKKALPKR